MQSWRSGFLGIETIPPWLGEFEVQQCFRLSPSENATVKTRRGNDKQLGLGLHIGFFAHERARAQFHRTYPLAGYWHRELRLSLGELAEPVVLESVRVLATS